MNKKSIFYGVLGGGLAGGAIYAIKKALTAASGNNDEDVPNEDDDMEYMDDNEEQEDTNAE